MAQSPFPTDTRSTPGTGQHHTPRASLCSGGSPSVTHTRQCQCGAHEKKCVIRPRIRTPHSRRVSRTFGRRLFSTSYPRIGGMRVTNRATFWTPISLRAWGEGRIRRQARRAARSEFSSFSLAGHTHLKNSTIGVRWRSTSSPSSEGNARQICARKHAKLLAK